MQFIFILLFFILWCWISISIVGEGGITILAILFISLPGIWVVYSAFKALRIAFDGERLTFDKKLDSYSVNNSEKCKISNISYVHIKPDSDSDGHTDYRLSLALLDDKKVFIDRSSSKEDIDEMAYEIARFIRVSIKLKK